MPAADRNAARRSVGTTTGGPASSTRRNAPHGRLGRRPVAGTVVGTWMPPATPVGDRNLGYPEACCPEALVRLGRRDRRRRNRTIRRRCRRCSTTRDPQDSEAEYRRQDPCEPADDRDQTEHAKDAPSQQEREEAGRSRLQQKSTDRMGASHVPNRVEKREAQEQEQA